MAIECENCHKLQAVLRFRGKNLCRRCLYPDQEEGYIRSTLIILTGNPQYDPESFLPETLEDLEHIKKPLSRALERHRIGHAFSTQALLPSSW